MASIFSTNKPKRFEHISHFTKNERKQWLEARVRKVKREMGELPPVTDIEPDHFKGKFSQFTPRARRASEREHKLTWPLVLILVLVLLLVWYYIVVGKI